MKRTSIHLLALFLSMFGSPLTEAEAAQTRIPMIRLHGGFTGVPELGVLELTDQGIAWTEARGKKNETSSTACGEIQKIEMGPNLNQMDIHTAKSQYKLLSLEGTASAVILDRIRLLCNLGEPELNSSIAGADDANVPKNSSAEKNASFDVFLDKGGGRGVLFVSRAGVGYEQLAHQTFVQGVDLGWKGIQNKTGERVPRLNLPCDNLTDISVHNIKLEVDIDTAGTTYRFFLGPNIHPSAIKQAIADFCSR